MNIKLDGSRLLCVCGSNNLHHESVKVFWREDEDSQEGTFFESKRVYFNNHIDPNDNPSRRRDGLLVRFWCENCSAEPELAISQHKGTTYVEWQSIRQTVAA
jgi:hypothetical protein